MAGVLKHWREAATLMILAPSRLQPSTFARPVLHNQAENDPKKQTDSESKNETNPDYETLVLKRSNKSKFMPNLYVFPGGTVENNDFSSEWVSVFGKLGKDFQQSMFDKVSKVKGTTKAPPMFTRQREEQFSEIPPEVAFRICAIRETFEESGILIVKKVDQIKGLKKKSLSEEWNLCSSLPTDTVELEQWRERVNENPDNFLTMCKELDLIPDILSLYEWTNWLTPTLMGGKRFDTIFYICCLEDKPQTKEDTFETVAYQWMSPISLLSSYYNKQGTALAPPQVYELSRLMHFKKVSKVMEFAADREAERVELFFPVIVLTTDAVVSLMPGDDLYPENPDFYTPQQVIQYDCTMKELDQDKSVENYHRSISRKVKSASLNSIKYNLGSRNKHVGPVLNLDKDLLINGKL